MRLTPPVSTAVLNVQLPPSPTYPIEAVLKWHLAWEEGGTGWRSLTLQHFLPHPWETDPTM